MTTPAAPIYIWKNVYTYIGMQLALYCVLPQATLRTINIQQNWYATSK